MAQDKRQMSVRLALEWAFMTECAFLDLSDGRNELRPNVGIEWKVIQQMKVSNYRIQGGGRSDAHPDAEIIAAALTRMSQISGFTKLAIMIAEHARNGLVPDWMPGAVPQLEPAEWKRGSRFKRMSKEQVLRRYKVPHKQPHPKYPGQFITRMINVEETWCPIVWPVTLSEIQSARKDYTGWVVALNWLRDKLISDGDLDTIEITERLPTHRPWEQQASQPAETLP